MNNSNEQIIYVISIEEISRSETDKSNIYNKEEIELFDNPKLSAKYVYDKVMEKGQKGFKVDPIKSSLMIVYNEKEFFDKQNEYLNLDSMVEAINNLPMNKRSILYRLSQSTDYFPDMDKEITYFKYRIIKKNITTFMRGDNND